MPFQKLDIKQIVAQKKAESIRFRFWYWYFGIEYAVKNWFVKKNKDTKQ